MGSYDQPRYTIPFAVSPQILQGQVSHHPVSHYVYQNPQVNYQGQVIYQPSIHGTNNLYRNPQDYVQGQGPQLPPHHDNSYAYQSHHGYPVSIPSPPIYNQAIINEQVQGYCLPVIPGQNPTSYPMFGSHPSPFGQPIQPVMYGFNPLSGIYSHVSTVSRRDRQRSNSADQFLRVTSAHQRSLERNSAHNAMLNILNRDNQSHNTSNKFNSEDDWI
jgi:hypothetical protein